MTTEKHIDLNYKWPTCGQPTPVIHPAATCWNADCKAQACSGKLRHWVKYESTVYGICRRRVSGQPKH